MAGVKTAESLCIYICVRQSRTQPQDRYIVNIGGRGLHLEYVCFNLLLLLLRCPGQVNVPQVMRHHAAVLDRCRAEDGAVIVAVVVIIPVGNFTQFRPKSVGFPLQSFQKFPLS